MIRLFTLNRFKLQKIFDVSLICATNVLGQLMTDEQKNKTLDLAIDGHPTTQKFLDEQTAAERIVQLNPAEQLRLGRDTISSRNKVNFNEPYLTLNF